MLVSAHAVAKASTRMYARRVYTVYGEPVVVVRPFITYGPWQQPDKSTHHTLLALLRGG